MEEQEGKKQEHNAKLEKITETKRLTEESENIEKNGERTSGNHKLKVKSRIEKEKNGGDHK